MIPLHSTACGSCLGTQGPSSQVLLLSLLDVMLSWAQTLSPNFLARPQFLPLVSMLQPCLMGAVAFWGDTKCRTSCHLCSGLAGTQDRKTVLMSLGHSYRVHVLALPASPLERCLPLLNWDLRGTGFQAKPFPSTGEPDTWRILGNVT